jgi:hypothetical protein
MSDRRRWWGEVNGSSSTPDSVLAASDRQVSPPCHDGFMPPRNHDAARAALNDRLLARLED